MVISNLFVTKCIYPHYEYRLTGLYDNSGGCDYGYSLSKKHQLLNCKSIT